MAASPQDRPDADWRPKAIVFDLLTALIDSWSLWDASTPSGTAAEGRRWRARYLEVTFGAGAYVPYEDLVRRAARDVGLPPEAPDALLRGWGGLRPWPGAGAVLRSLRARGYGLAVVTNCSRRLGHLAARGVERSAGAGDNDGDDDDDDDNDNDGGGDGDRGGDRGGGGGGREGCFAFDAVVTAEESGFYKPVGAAYEAVLTAMALRPEDVLFVAGSAGDVQGATDAGMRVVWHNKVGLAKKGEAVPLREGDSLDDALKGFL